MAAHQKLNSLISVFLITLINPLKKNILGANVSVTQDWLLHPPSAVQSRRERKDNTYYGRQRPVTELLWHPKFQCLASEGHVLGQKLKSRCALICQYYWHDF